MWRRHSIVNKKMNTAASRGKLYAKMSRIIEIHAKKGWNPDLNPSLALAIQKAKQNGVTRDIIQKAVKKWSGQLSSAAYTEIYYEGYGPGWCAIYIKTFTDNNNRSSTNIRVCMQKYGGTFGEPGSVARQFNQKGIISISWISKIQVVKGNEIECINPYSQDTLEMDAIELWAEDVEFEDWICTVTTSRMDYFIIDGSLTKLWYNIVQSDIECVCDNMMIISEIDSKQLHILIEHLESDDDVQKVWTNVI